MLVFALVYHQINNFDDERVEAVFCNGWSELIVIIFSNHGNLFYTNIVSKTSPTTRSTFPLVVFDAPPVVTNLVDPVWCLRKAYPKYSGPAHGAFVLGSADELKRPHNLRNNLLLFNLC